MQVLKTWLAGWKVRPHRSVYAFWRALSLVISTVLFVAGTLGEEGEDQIDFDSPENAHLKITEEVKDYVRKLSKSPGTFMKHPRRKDASEFNNILFQQLGFFAH